MVKITPFTKEASQMNYVNYDITDIMTLLWLIMTSIIMTTLAIQYKPAS